MNNLIIDIKLWLIELFPILLKYHRWKVRRQNKKLEKAGKNYIYAPYIMPIINTPTITNCKNLEKYIHKEVNQKYYG